MQNVVIIGAGALGSHLTLLLRNEPVRLSVVDFDRVEAKNLQSQFHTTMGVGKLKAQALRQAMQGLFKVSILDFPRKLSTDNIDQLLKEADLVVDCTDNGATRRLLIAFCTERGIPLLHGALAANGVFGQVLWSPLFKVDDKDSEEQPTCENGAFLPFIGLVAAYLGIAIQTFFKEGKKVGFQLTPNSFFKV